MCGTAESLRKKKMMAEGVIQPGVSHEDCCAFGEKGCLRVTP